MSRPFITLPATGGGSLLLGLTFSRYFLAISAVLLAIALWEIWKTLRGLRHVRG